jgi:phosphatidylinositol-3-phosphatase
MKYPKYWAKIMIGLVAAIVVLAVFNPLSVRAASTTLTFTPTADTYVSSDYPTDNYGSVVSLRIDSSPIKHTYLRFSVSGLNGNPVSSATLKFYANSSLSAGFSVNKLSNNTWTESTLTYDNAPAPGSAITNSGAVTSGTWVSINITSYITGDGSYNLVLMPLSSTMLNLASRETGSTAPQLAVTFGATASATPTRTATPQTIVATPTKTATPKPTATSTAPTPTRTGGSGVVPKFSHVIIMIFENKEYSSIIGQSTLPNFNQLAQKYTLLTKSYAVAHPSLPNYIALTSGSTQGITSDCTTCYLNVKNIADSIEASGRSWKGYMENMPTTCYIGSSGLYVQKHDPFIYYDDIRTNTTRCQQHVVPLTQLDTDLKNNALPAFAWITPNQCNNSHDCSAATADKFLGPEVNKIITSPAFDQNSLLVITFDEGSSSATCCGLPTSAGGHIATILISPMVKSGYQDTTPYSHYSVLKTIEKSWGLSYLGHAADTATTLITAPWK